MTKAQVRASVEEIGIIPAVRTSSAEEARFAAEAVFNAGIPIAEIDCTGPEAVDTIADLVRRIPELIVGAEVISDMEMARQCVAAGARFLTSPALDLRIVAFAVSVDVFVLPGALTPTEVITAWQAGADLVKVVPCSQVGGESYIRALKAPLPQVPLVAAGGVNQQTAADFILAGATALGIGRELLPTQAIRLKKPDWIRELARRFLTIVKDTRREAASRHKHDAPRRHV